MKRHTPVWQVVAVAVVFAAGLALALGSRCPAGPGTTPSVFGVPVGRGAALVAGAGGTGVAGGTGLGGATWLALTACTARAERRSGGRGRGDGDKPGD